ncbi:MAG: Cna B-type domain-containing protein [Clostridiales bacterium]|nr:Cna B-type domain-containing protein [Clostridiales bacterium]
MKNRKLALAMTLVMLLSLFSVSTFGAFADETAEGGGQDTAAAVEEPAEEAKEAEEVPDAVPEEGTDEAEAPAVEAPAQDSSEPEEQQLSEEAAAVPAEEEEPEISKTQAGNPPAAVATVDSRADGITLNLFDYDLTDDPVAGDTWNNSPTSPMTNYWPEAGINAGHNLKFFGHGGDPALSGNSNIYTGQTTARQGIVQPMLGESGYPVMTEFGGQDLGYLFAPESTDYKTAYTDVNHLFQIDGQGNYVFDSNKNYAYYDPAQGSGGDYKVYDGTYPVKETSYDGTDTGNTMPVGYFPFDDWNENKQDVEPAIEASAHGEEPYNHQHGLSMECDFYIPASGKVDGDDLKFHFSGDDDAWLFIDDVLVLDIGGLHMPTGGDVNFTTGEVTTDDAVDVVPYDSSTAVPQTIGTQNTLSAIFAAAGKEWDPSAPHHMKFFYLERGGCYSNLALATNVWKATGMRFSVEKVWKDEEDHSKDEVIVDLYADGELAEGKTLTLNEGNNWKDTFNNLPMYNEDGEAITYTVKEENVDDYIASYEKGGEVVKEKTYWVPIDAADLEDGETYAITAPNWQSGDAPRIFEGTEGLIETVPATIKEQAVPGENQQLVDEEGAYEQVLKNDPSEAQLFTAAKLDSDGVQEGTFWQLSNGSGNLTLVGHQDWGMWGRTISYWYTMTEETGWHGWPDNNNFHNALTIEPEEGGTAMIYAAQYIDDPLVRQPEQYLLLNNGTHPDPTNVRDWSAHVTFWKQVTVQETTPLPDDWKIINAPAGDLVVTKTVKGTEAQKKQAFTFVVKLDDSSINGEFGDMTFSNGIAMFTLKDGEIITAEDLPAGVGYEVIEAAGADYTADSTGDKGTIKAKTDAVAAFTNTFKDEQEPQPVPPEKETTPTDSTPKTGDDTTAVLILLALLTSGSLMALTARRRKEQ